MSNRGQGEYLYSFAVVADTHLNQNDVECNSPFGVNRRANNRLRYVIADLNRRELEFVVHLGDVVHPVPSMGKLYTESAQRFFEQFAELKHPYYLVPGNHDVGDKPLDWGPAGTVRDEFLDAWIENFGAHYFHHEHRGGIHFIGLNSQLLGSGLAREEEQKTWTRSLLDKLKGQRIFVGSHYPPYLLRPNEAEHYDNLGPGARRWLLALLAEFDVEALFCGHVHQYWFHQFARTRCHLLPSTAFTRQDYSEMFRVGSGDEFGRNDEPKLGYMLVHLFEDGHGVEIVRTDGRELEAGKESFGLPAFDKAPSFCNFHSALGFDLRHDWCETVQIPPSGGLDEFDRKSVRNDYGLLALLDMGVRKLRLPLTDLTEKNRRDRLRELTAFGFDYRFYSFGTPDEPTWRIARENRDLIGAWELCCRVDESRSFDSSFLAWARQEGISLTFSPLRSKQDLLDSGKKYFHVVNHGFTVRDAEMFARWVDSEAAAVFDSYLLRLAFDESVESAVLFADSQNAETGKRAVIHLRLSENNPAVCLDDDLWLCRRLAEALLRGHANAAFEFICDTFSDNDRGYFPRAGVVDRRYNPRSGMRLIQNINTLLSGWAVDDTPLAETGPRGVSFALNFSGKDCCIFIPREDHQLAEIDADREFNAERVAGRLILNLVSSKLVRLDSKSDLAAALSGSYPFALLDVINPREDGSG